MAGDASLTSDSPLGEDPDKAEPKPSSKQENGESPNTTAGLSFDDELAQAELKLWTVDGANEERVRTTDSFDFSNSMSGVAVSGGGIRSAAFNLGFVESLLKVRLFQKLDYLSTVSGGGYIGACISGHALSRRASGDDKPVPKPQESEKAKEAAATPPPQDRGYPIDPAATRFDDDLLRYLRENCRYLTPSTSNRVCDWMTLIANILVGLVIHLAMALVFFGIAFLPLKFEPAAWELVVEGGRAFVGLGRGGLVLFGTLAMAFFFLQSVVPSLAKFRDAVYSVLGLALVPILVGLSIKAHELLVHDHYQHLTRWVAYLVAPSGFAAAYGALRPSLLPYVKWSRMRKAALYMAAFLILVALGHLSYWFYDGGLFYLILQARPDGSSMLPSQFLVEALDKASACIRILVAILILIHLFFLTRRGLPETSAGPGADLLEFKIVQNSTWLAYGCFLVYLLVNEYLPQGVGRTQFEHEYEFASLLILGLALLLGYVTWINLKSRSVLLVTLSSAYFVIQAMALVIVNFWWMTKQHPSGMEHAYWHLYLVVLVLGLAFCLFTNLNRSSLHGFYRDQLARLFLRSPDSSGASVDVPLRALGKKVAGLPYQIIQCAVNLPQSRDRKLAERKAESFFITGARLGSKSTGLASPDRFNFKDEELTLASAMAVSGAAVNSHHGRDFPPVVSFLLTLLNLRLGYWLPNPRHVRKADRPFGLENTVWPLLFVKEMLSSFNSGSDRCLLSDGGHFDNLGLYELVRRKCRFILVSDAGADPGRSFSDLANAVRKCRLDFDCEIEIDLSLLKPDAESGISSRHAAIGEIRYRSGAAGILIYVKSSLTGDEPADVLQYRRANPTFPHQSTLDQFFDEAQFEAYRRLGEHVGSTVFGTKEIQDAQSAFEQARSAWRQPAEDGGKAFLDLAKGFMDLETASILRGPNRLDSQQFPEFFDDLPIPSENDHELFHHTLRQVQLMENVWMSLRLNDERNRDHPDNRGWMNLFRRWAISEHFRSVYEVMCSIYGQEFQRFCESELGLSGKTLQFGIQRGATDEDKETCHSILSKDELVSSLDRRWKQIEQGTFHVARLSRHPNTILGFVTVLDFSTLTGPITEGAEIVCTMTDNRFYHCGIASKLVQHVVQCHRGKTMVILPPAGNSGFDKDQWERLARYFSYYGFAVGGLPIPTPGGESAQDKCAREMIVRAGVYTSMDQLREIPYLYRFVPPAQPAPADHGV